MTMNKNERMNALDTAGIDTSKYFTFGVAKDLPKGTKITVTIGEDGVPVVNNIELDEMLNKIDEEGYVANNSLFRRWVMAQTFRMLRHPEGYSKALEEKPYKYQWEVLENELNVMRKIQKEDPKRFEERKIFFTKKVIQEMFADYLAKFDEWRQNKYWGISDDVYAREANETAKQAYVDITMAPAEDYEKFYKIIADYNFEVKRHSNYKLKANTPKCKAWIDAFKGTGAYYTVQNILRFHLPSNNVYIPGLPEGYSISAKLAEEILENKAKEYQGEFWRLFAFMKEVIRLNDFKFKHIMKLDM